MAHVVLVDDEELVAELCAALLRKGGHNVSIAHDGEEALRLIHELHPDVVVSDIRLPGMDGHQLARALKAQSSTMQIPVLLMSGHGFAEKNSCDAFVAKPFCVPEFLATVKRLVTRSGKRP
jgi:CheY-like chemotaxis protein